MKYLFNLFIYIFMLVILTGCNSKVSRLNNEITSSVSDFNSSYENTSLALASDGNATKASDKVSNNNSTTQSQQPFIEEGKQFKIINDINNGWDLFVYDKNGNVVDSGHGGMVTPSIKYVTDNILEERFHGGTYADSCRYYDIDANTFSGYYSNPFLVKDRKIVDYDASSKILIVRDIFSESIYYKEFSRDIYTFGPPIAIEFINNDTQLSITYYDGTRKNKISETIQLDD